MTDDLPKLAAYKEFANMLTRPSEHTTHYLDCGCLTEKANAAIAELEAACKDRERCGCCEHYRNCEIEFCMANPSPDGQFPMHWSDRCHFTPSKWELCLD